MVIPCNLPTPTGSPPYSAVGTGPPDFLGSFDSTHDVFFTVGALGDTWTIPGHRAQLAAKCPVLGVVMRDAGRDVRLDVDKRGFELFLSYIQDLDIKFTSIQTARSTLDISCKFQCPGLTRKCVEYLDEHLDVSNVLEVFMDLTKWCNNAHSNSPNVPFLGAGGLTQDGRVIQDLCSSLLHNCLILIDTHCTEVITQEIFENLSRQDIATIISRDTLNIKSEFILYESIMRWYRCKCMKMGNRPQNPSSRKEILGDLIFKVRFGLMERPEFLAGPAQAAIFTSNEINEILNIIDNSSNPVTDGLFKNINVKRKVNKDEPEYLSERTLPKNGKLKSKKDKSKSNTALMNCLTVWTVLFD